MELKHSEQRGLERMVVSLLIVPYGIETGFDKFFFHFKSAFNRTLWN